ncbi:MAG: excalibur calcium-binding domain-containing protein [Marmoricola sp.]
MRRWALPALMAGSFGLVLFVAPPASADVDCGDLTSRAAAQTYFDGRTGDPDRLDSDGDGRACEGNDGSSTSTWILVAFGMIMAGALVCYSRFDRTEQQVEETLPLETVVVGTTALPEQASAGAEGPAGRRREVLASASTGSIGELARGLRMVQYAERMTLLERHAADQGRSPQQVLDDLAEHTSDLELQGWALAGYDPPWTVRVMRCSCVDGMRNFRLQAAPDGSHYWACASCHTSDRNLS